MPDDALGQHRAQAPVPGVGGRHDQYLGEAEAPHHLLFELGVRPDVRRHDHRHEAGLPGLLDEPRHLDTRQPEAVRRLLVGQPELEMQPGYARQKVWRVAGTARGTNG